MPKIKKIFDLLLIFLSLPLTLPTLFVDVMLLALTQLNFPILFRQPRTGLNGKIFNIYKFRTMTR